MWSDKLKETNVSIHIAATGAGAGLQEQLWEVPGSSAYLSGASFPYAPEEQAELLGFMPEHFCSQEAAVDLASAAYMKAYRFGGKKPVGVGIAASVASDKPHRGEHRVWVCVMTDEKILTLHHTFDKEFGGRARYLQGKSCDDAGFYALLDVLGVGESSITRLEYADATELATQRFWARSMFLPNGQRVDPQTFKFDGNLYALMPGAFNPPHQGHYGIADQVKLQVGTDIIFEICATHPIKPALTVQEMLQRAQLLRGCYTLFTKDSLYIDKARNHPNMPMVVGADAMLRILDPQWGDPEKQLKEFAELGTEFFVGSRVVDGKLITVADIEKKLPPIFRDEHMHDVLYMFRPIKGQWDISSTEIREMIK